MTHTLEDLKSGKLKGSERLKLACNLTEFPKEILSLAETLEVLDLSDNQLNELPDCITQLKHLKILFFARNNFTEFPEILYDFPVLRMIGFKSNQITTVPENAFPVSLSWLILTDNKIKELPKSIGNCPLLRKCALAGNLIPELPSEMSRCINLELLRISANKLTVIPKWLFELPKLAWVAFGGNPAAPKIKTNIDLASYAWDNFTINKLLGEGASGVISQAKWHVKEKSVAIKVFKGNVTSDGLPDDEMEIAIATGSHESLIPILGKIKEHPENKSALLMELIAPTYSSLGNPPSLDTCTRDVFEKECVFTYDELLKIATNIASVCKQLHQKGINHGDLYAHNILINPNAHCLLGDFGAASFYDTYSISHNIQRIEVRAYGCLLEDILGLITETNIIEHHKWNQLIKECFNENVKARPSFSDILERLN